MMPTKKNMWWGYLHANNTIQAKRWWGDHADYTTDCQCNPFIQKVCKPFEANNRDEALTHLKEYFNK